MDDNHTPGCTGRAIRLTLNAMGVDEVVRVVLDKAGDIDFSGIPREPINIEDIDEIDLDKATKGEQTPGGFEVSLLRVAYHTASGSENSSTYHIEELIGPGPFHEKPDWTSSYPMMEDIIRAHREHGHLSLDTDQPDQSGVRLGGPRF